MIELETDNLVVDKSDTKHSEASCRSLVFIVEDEYETEVSRHSDFNDAYKYKRKHDLSGDSLFICHKWIATKQH